MYRDGIDTEVNYEQALHWPTDIWIYGR